MGENLDTPESNERQTRLDEATSRRLAKLRTVPMNTSGLLRAVEAAIPRPKAQSRRLVLTWLKSRPGLAASLLLTGLIIALVIHSSAGPVLASADNLARIHEEVLHAHGSDHTPVNSIDAANALLAAKCPGLPPIPGLPKVPVMSCCVHELGRKKVGCVSVQVDEVPVSIAVAEASDVKIPPCESLTIDGIAYHVQSKGDINMVMTERNGRWVCVMGKLPTSRVAELANSLRF